MDLGREGNTSQTVFKPWARLQKQKRKEKSNLSNSQICCLRVMSKSRVLGVTSLLMLQFTSACDDLQTLFKFSYIFLFFFFLMACCFSPPSFSNWNAASLLRTLLHFGSFRIISFCFTKGKWQKETFWLTLILTTFFSQLFIFILLREWHIILITAGSFLWIPEYFILCGTK